MGAWHQDGRVIYRRAIDVRDIGHVGDVVLDNRILLNECPWWQWRPPRMAREREVQLHGHPCRFVAVFPGRINKDRIVAAPAVNDTALEAPIPVRDAVV